MNRYQRVTKCQEEKRISKAEFSSKSFRSPESVRICVADCYKNAPVHCSPDWWESKAVGLQRVADRNDIKGFYNGLKEVWGPNKNYYSPCLAT